jgi:hypothetical protein
MPPVASPGEPEPAPGPLDSLAGGLAALRTALEDPLHHAAAEFAAAASAASAAAGSVGALAGLHLGRSPVPLQQTRMLTYRAPAPSSVQLPAAANGHCAPSTPAYYVNGSKNEQSPSGPGPGPAAPT